MTFTERGQAANLLRKGVSAIAAWWFALTNNSMFDDERWDGRDE